MSYDVSERDAVYQITIGGSKERRIWRHPIVEVTEKWVKAQKTPDNADSNEDEWEEDGGLYLDRRVLEDGKPARNGRAHSVFFLRRRDAEARL